MIREAHAALLPQAGLDAGVDRQRLNLSTFGLSQPPMTFNVFSIGPTVSYAVDLFGGNRRRVEEARALADYQRYQLGAAYLAVTGNTVIDALTIGSIATEIATVREIIADDERTLNS